MLETYSSSSNDFVSPVIERAEGIISGGFLGLTVRTSDPGNGLNGIKRVLVLVTYRDTDIDRTHPLSGVLADLRRLPDVDLLIQLDEPMLPAVLAGTIANASGFQRHPAIEPSEITAATIHIVDRLASTAVAVHC